jgi:acetyl esterase
MTRSHVRAFVLLALCVVATQSHAREVVGPVREVYARRGDAELRILIYRPDDLREGERRPAIVSFHGGGWGMGEPEWAEGNARHWAARGMVAFSAQYRLASESTTPADAVADARAAIRWIRENSTKLGVDPSRIAAHGWSAGAHLAASAAVLRDSEDHRISAQPNALVLFSPAVDVENDKHFEHILRGSMPVRALSPAAHVRGGLPPAILLQGNVDTVTPLRGAQRFCERMREHGNRCELVVYPDVGHLFTPKGIPDDGWPKPDARVSAMASEAADGFLASLGYLDVVSVRPDLLRKSVEPD